MLRHVWRGARSVSSRSLRARLLVIVALLAIVALASGSVMVALFEQSTTARIGQGEALTGRACDAVGRAYRVHVGNAASAPADPGQPGLRGDLAAIAASALAGRAGIEGGLWHEGAGPIAYAFPTYPGSGPKTDLPQAELPRIAATIADAFKERRPTQTRLDAGGQSLLIAACPLLAPNDAIAAWAMMRVYSLGGQTYWHLMLGLGVLVALVIVASGLVGLLITTWSRHVAGIVGVLAANGEVLPRLPATGERELDHIVEALNTMGERLAASHRQTVRLSQDVAASERLAAIGRVTAGVAHEIRNPIAAMRLRAELALTGAPERKDMALRLVIEQVDRLELLIRRLLTASERDPPHIEAVALDPFLARCIETHTDAAAARGVALVGACSVPVGRFDSVQMGRAIGNLVANALQESPPGTVTLAADRDGADLVLAVSDGGAGPPDDIRGDLFEPFVSGAAGRAGLGLAIVREIASAHGGRADFVRIDGLTTFRILVPCPAS